MVDSVTYLKKMDLLKHVSMVPCYGLWIGLKSTYTKCKIFYSKSNPNQRFMTLYCITRKINNTYFHDNESYVEFSNYFWAIY